MAEAKMLRGVNGEIIQMFRLEEGKVNLTSTTAVACNALWCTVDATVTATWPSGETDDIAFVEGDMASFPEGTTITHTSGTLHIM